MKIAVMGTGAVGGYFGARLAVAGHDVTFVARGAHAAAIREHGLHVLSTNGDLHVRPTRLYDPAADTDEPRDVVLVAVKMYDLADAAATIRPLVGAGTVVVPLENGVEAVDILRAALGEVAEAGGVAYIGGHIEAPGVIRHVGSMARLVFGEPNAAEERAGDGRSRQLAALKAACDAAGVEATLADDIEREIWTKFVFLAPFAGITGYARAPIGPIRDDAGLWSRFAAMVEEAVAVARARGVRLPDDIVASRLAFVRGLPAPMRSSMLTDLEAGRRLELDWLTGAVVRLGRAAGVPTPVSEEVYAALAPLADGGRA